MARLAEMAFVWAHVHLSEKNDSIPGSIFVPMLPAPGLEKT